MRVPRTWPMGVMVCLCVALSPWAALAQSNQAAAAEALFREGQQLFDAGSYPQACPKFAASYELDPGLGTLLNLARCHEKAGHTASAWAAYVDLQSLATREGHNDRVNIATERIAALEPRLVRLKLATSESQDGREIMLDGKLFNPTLVHVAMPVDPGEHRIEARAEGHTSWSKTVTVTKEGSTTVVQVPTLAAVVPPPAPVVAPPRPKEVPPRPLVDPAPIPPPDDGPSPWLIGGLVTGGVGVALLAVGSGFAADASSAWSDADCRNALCTTRAAQDLSEQANRNADIASGLLVGGGALLAGGLAMVIAASVSGTETSPITWTLDGVRVSF